MASARLSDYVVSCNKDNVGGLASVYILPFKNVVSVVEKSNVIEAINITPGAAWLQFGVIKGTATLVISPARDGFNTCYNESLSLAFNKLSKVNTDLIKGFLKGLFVILTKDRNGGYVMLGRNVGARFSSGNIGSGTGSADRNGGGFSLVSVAKKVSHVSPLVMEGSVIPATRIFEDVFQIQFQ